MTFFLQFWWFLKFVSFGGNLSAKGKQFHLWKKNLIFWHPWDPWERVHIDLNKNSVWTGCVYKLLQLLLPCCWPRKIAGCEFEIIWLHCDTKEASVQGRKNKSDNKMHVVQDRRTIRKYGANLVDIISPPQISICTFFYIFYLKYICFSLN